MPKLRRKGAADRQTYQSIRTGVIMQRSISSVIMWLNIAMPCVYMCVLSQEGISFVLAVVIFLCSRSVSSRQITHPSLCRPAAAGV